MRQSVAPALPSAALFPTPVNTLKFVIYWIRSKSVLELVHALKGVKGE